MRDLVAKQAQLIDLGSQFERRVLLFVDVLRPREEPAETQPAAFGQLAVNGFQKLPGLEQS